MKAQANQAPEDETNKAILARFRESGFRTAFDILWLYHQQRLARFVRGRGLAPDRAEDLLQDIGLKLYHYLSGHVVAIFPGAAYKITKDEIADFYRGLQRLPKLESLDDLIAMDLDPVAAPPSKRMERWTALQTHMETKGVSREQQTAVILKHLIGYSLVEVAQITACDPETVKSRLRYASLKMGGNRKQRGVA